MVGVVRSPTDFKTVDRWGKTIGVARGTLRGWCRAAHVRAQDSLDFARMLRAVLILQDRPWDLQNVLDVVDDRTLVHLLGRGQVPGLRGARRPPEPLSFIRNQGYVRQELLLDTVADLLSLSPQKYQSEPNQTPDGPVPPVHRSG